MSANFEIDESESDYTMGYIRGISTQIATSDHIDSVLDFVYRELGDRFELAVDQKARFSKDLWYHVYEWGDTWNTRKDNAGVPGKRLWKLTSVRSGSTRSVGFVFLPSVRPSPIHPEEEKRGVEAGKHIFTWKAPVMEYGMTVTISPVEALKGMLVFYWEQEERVVATKKTITTTTDPKVQGVFTGFFVTWWGTIAPMIFDKELRPMIEREVVPRNKGRFAKGRSKTASRALARGGGVSGVTRGLNIRSANEERGRNDAIREMQRIAAGYRHGKGGYENYGH